MNKKKSGLLGYFFLLLLTISCGNNEKSDAYGNFEATAITVSAKGNGELLYFDIEEGASVKAKSNVGIIDTTQLYLEKQQLAAQLRALQYKTKEAGPEIAVLIERRSNLIRERNRTEVLLKQKAATQKQLDDYNGEIDVINKQITSASRDINVANRGILADQEPLEAQIRILEQKIRDHVIVNPLSGTVLTKLAEPAEYVTQGKPLYKIANLDYLKLRAYTSAVLLQGVKLKDKVTVLVDDGEDNYRKLEGTITWIADEAEFTPKTIETKEERVNLVYAIDVEVKNDGTLKIGMPGEVLFNE